MTIIDYLSILTLKRAIIFKFAIYINSNVFIVYYCTDSITVCTVCPRSLNPFRPLFCKSALFFQLPLFLFVLSLFLFLFSTAGFFFLYLSIRYSYFTTLIH